VTVWACVHCKGSGDGHYTQECPERGACQQKHDVPWSSERVRERLLWWFLGAIMSAGLWLELGKRLQ
jgi:hypothetical protein